MTFESDLRRAERKLQTKIKNIYRSVVVSVFNDVIVGSVVDTGRFRANWMATLNTPASGYDESLTASHIPRAGKMLGTTKIDDTFYLTNNLPYSVTLVDNPSPRWVEKTALKAKDYMLLYINKRLVE